MDLNIFKDILFDLINESDDLDIADIQAYDEKDLLMVAMKDRSVFAIRTMKVN